MNHILCTAIVALTQRDWTFVSAAVFMCLVGVLLVALRHRLKMGNFFPILFLSISLLFAAFVVFGLWFGMLFHKGG